MNKNKTIKNAFDRLSSKISFMFVILKPYYHK